MIKGFQRFGFDLVECPSSLPLIKMKLSIKLINGELLFSLTNNPTELV